MAEHERADSFITVGDLIRELEQLNDGLPLAVECEHDSGAAHRVWRTAIRPTSMVDGATHVVTFSGATGYFNLD